MTKNTTLFSFILLFIASFAYSQNNTNGVKIGVVGLNHDHVHWIFRYVKDGSVNMVGIVEPNQELAKRFADRYGFSLDIVYPDIESMLDKAKPDAVTAFNPIKEHLDVVEACAPRGIDVMVEKPLAATLKDARKIEALAREHNIHVLTNYETTWYDSNHKVYDEVLIQASVGELRKVIVRDGHEGPKEIGVSEEFLSWLTDPELNGGGALIDFGCYGANLMTWLMQGEKPESVTAILKSIKPNVYPKVEDEATVIVNYPKMQGIIQASWNWPFSRKDMSVYGSTGYVHALNANDMKIRKAGEKERELSATASTFSYEDPFSYFTDVVMGKVQIQANDLSSLENNMIVMEILDAAKRSAKSGKTIYLK